MSIQYAGILLCSSVAGLTPVVLSKGMSIAFALAEAYPSSAVVAVLLDLPPLILPHSNVPQLATDQIFVQATILRVHDWGKHHIGCSGVDRVSRTVESQVPAETEITCEDFCFQFTSSYTDFKRDSHLLTTIYIIHNT